MGRVNDALLGTSGTPSNTNRYVTSDDPRLSGGGTVTGVTATAPIASSGGTAPVISHNNSGVTAGTFTNANITVDAKGHVTAASSGSAGGVTSVSGTAPIVSSGGATPAISLADTAVTPGSYLNANITVDAKGRITTATNGSGAAPVAETPSGTVNGVNTTFTLSQTPASSAGVIVTLDGVVQRSGVGLDYTVSGTTITFAAAPASGSEIFAYYGYSVGTGGASGVAGGDLSGTYPNPTVAKVQGVAVSSSAPTSGQVLAYSGSQWAPTTLAMANLISAMQGRQLWVPPSVADSRDEEFDSGTLTGWTLLGSPVATAIDPYAAFSGVGWRYSANSYRPSWLMIQPDAALAATFQKSVSYNTNDLVWTRMASFRRSTTAIANEAQILLSISDTARTSRVDVLLTRYDAGAPVVRMRTVSGGVFSTIGEVPQGATVNDIEYLALQKIGSTFHGWCASSSGQWRYIGNTSTAATYTSVLVGASTADTTPPGNMILGVDFIRFLNSATQLP